jgi:hypothetical protein
MIPSWIPEDAWAGYAEMRKKIKKPMTERAIRLVINSLQRMKDAGQDVGAVLDQSTMNSWQGVFEVRVDRAQQQSSRPAIAQLGKHGQLTANNAQDWLEGQ